MSRRLESMRWNHARLLQAAGCLILAIGASCARKEDSSNSAGQVAKGRAAYTSNPALQAPRFPRWVPPASSEIETHLAALEPTLPSVELEVPEPDLIEAIDEVVDGWDPTSDDKWNHLRRADLREWNTKALHRMRARVLDENLPSTQRFDLLLKIAAFENSQAATVLEEILHSEAPPDLRARAAYQVSRAVGDWILEGLLAKFAPEFQNGMYFIADYYERDEFTELWIAEGICARGILSPLPYMLELEQRARDGGSVDSIYTAEAVRADAERLIRQICVRETEAFPDEASREEVRQRAGEIAEHWRRTGRAPVSALDPPFTIDDGSRLCARLCRRMLSFRTETLATPLRPVDEARRILVDLGAASLPMLRRGLHDPSLYVREYTLDVVIRLGPPCAPLIDDVLPLLGDPLVRVKVLEALAALGPLPAVEQWQGLVLSPDIETAQAAIEALSAFPFPSSVPWLLEAGQRMGSDSTSLRIALAAALSVQGRAEGLALWHDLADRTSEGDPLRLAHLVERSASALSLATGSEWPADPEQFLARVAEFVAKRGKTGAI